MATLWTKVDHEGGDLSQYTGEESSGTTVTNSASSSANKNGTYGLSVVANNTVDSSDFRSEYIDFTWPTSNKVRIEWWYQLASFTQDGYDTLSSKMMAVLENQSSGNTIVYINRQNDQLELCYLNDSFAKTSTTYTHDPTATTWYRYRLTVSYVTTTTTIKWEVSTDGDNFSTIGTFTGDTRLDNEQPDRFSIGVFHGGQFEKMQYTEYFDDIEGFDNDPPSPTITSLRFAPRFRSSR